MTFATVIRVAFAVVAAIATVAIVATAAAFATTAAATSPEALYGDEIRFAVFRNGEESGEHRVRFSRDPDGDLQVASSTRITVRILGILRAEFAHDSLARWRGDALLELSAKTRRPFFGASQVRAVRGEDGYAVNGRPVAPGPLFPTTHWNASALGQPRLLNTITGQVNAVAFSESGREEVEANGGRRIATRREVSGDLNITLWHDPDGRWLRLDFVDAGDQYSFRCRACAPGRR